MAGRLQESERKERDLREALHLFPGFDAEWAD